MRKIVLLTLIVTGLSMMSQVTKKRVGGTYYDLQTNNSIQRRIVLDDNGNIVMTYTGSGVNDGGAGAFNDRGTGYAMYNGTTWMNSSNSAIDTFFVQKLEGSSVNYRSGWPNPIIANGKEIVLSHKAGGSTDGFMYSRRNAVGTGTFSVTDTLVLNSKATWLRAANSGDSIFVIFSYGASGTTPTNSLNGTPSGIDYIVSYNGGLTWSKRDSIPGINLAKYPNGLGGDNYALDVKDSIVCILTGRADVTLYKSTNFGKTWKTPTTIVAGNNAPVVGGIFDYRSAGDFSVLIDKNNVTHCFWGLLYANDSLSYFRNKTGIVYWNETFTGGPRPSARQLLTKTIYDKDGPAAIQEYPFAMVGVFANDLTNFQTTYGTGYTSHPSSGIDAAGTIYLSYQKLRGISDTNRYNSGYCLDPIGNLMTDVYIMKSRDNGATWIGPFNVSNSDSTEDAFPSIARKVTNKAHIIYQEDALYGYAISSAGRASHNGLCTRNKIIYATVDTGAIVNLTDIAAPKLNLDDSATQKGFLNDTISFYLNCSKEVNSGQTITDKIAFFNQFVSCYDNVDGFSANLVKLDTPRGTGQNFTKSGIYPVYFYGKDAAGNVSKLFGNVVNGTLFRGSFDTLRFYVEVKTADVTPPVITLDSSNPIYIYRGTTFTRPTAFGSAIDDNPCGGVTYPTSKDNVNTSVNGQYYIRYYAADAAGNKDSVSRTVYVGKEPTADFINYNISTGKISATNNSTDIDAFSTVLYKWSLKLGSTTVSSSLSTIATLVNVSVPTAVKSFDSLCLSCSNDFNTRFNKPISVKCKYLKFSSSISDIQSNGLDVKAYPNPSNGVIFVNFNEIGMNQKATIRVTDIQGKVVYNQVHKANSNEAIMIDLTHLNSGLYLLSSEIEGKTDLKKLQINIK
jgi:hypothetical protein